MIVAMTQALPNEEACSIHHRHILTGKGSSLSWRLTILWCNPWRHSLP